MPSSHDMRERDNAQQLIELLVQPQHMRLYQNSASFNHQINSLVRMLPLWIEFLAQQAASREEELTAETRSLASQSQIDPRIMRDMQVFG